jgi:hypothetical protein
VLPSESFITFMRRTYSPDAADAVLKGLAEAQDSFDLEGLVHDHVGPQRTRSLHLLIMEPRTPRVRLETLTPGRYTIGRLGCSIIVRDEFASRTHCALIVHSSKSVSVRDISDRNGTFVDGLRIPANEDYPIHLGGQIMIGKSALELVEA